MHYLILVIIVVKPEPTRKMIMKQILKMTLDVAIKSTIDKIQNENFIMPDKLVLVVFVVV